MYRFLYREVIGMRYDEHLQKLHGHHHIIYSDLLDECVWNYVCKQCIKDIQTVANQLGFQPTKAEYRSQRTTRMQSTESICVHLGSWPRAMGEAGFDAKLAIRNYRSAQ